MTYAMYDLIDLIVCSVISVTSFYGVCYFGVVGSVEGGVCCSPLCHSCSTVYLCCSLVCHCCSLVCHCCSPVCHCCSPVCHCCSPVCHCCSLVCRLTSRVCCLEPGVPAVSSVLSASASTSSIPRFLFAHQPLATNNNTTFTTITTATTPV